MVSTIRVEEQYKPDNLRKITTDRTSELDFPNHIGPHVSPMFYED